MGTRTAKGRPRHLLVEVTKGTMRRGSINALLEQIPVAPKATATVVAPTQFLVRTTQRNLAQVRAALNGEVEGGTVRLRTVRTSGTIASLRHLLPPEHRTRAPPPRRSGPKPKI